MNRPQDMDLVGRAVGVVCAAYRVTPGDLEGHSREWRRVWPRWICIGLVRRHTGLSLKEIGMVFGRCHTAIIHALQGLENEVQTSCERGREVAEMERRMGSNRRSFRTGHNREQRA